MPSLLEEERVQQRQIEARLGREQTIWLATTRADGRPHLAPVWFIYHGGSVFICTAAGSQKMFNMERIRKATVALPNTQDVLILEGTVGFPRGNTVDEVARQFNDKYGWDMLQDTDADWKLAEIIPSKVLTWKTNG